MLVDGRPCRPRVRLTMVDDVADSDRKEPQPRALGQPANGGMYADVGPKRKRGIPTLDSTTGTVYRSRNMAYVSLAASGGLDPYDRYGWDKLCRKFPGRFVDVNPESPADPDGLSCDFLDGGCD